MSRIIRDTDVFIVGAGPTGLVLALWLTRLGWRVRIVDRTEGTRTPQNPRTAFAFASPLGRESDSSVSNSDKKPLPQHESATLAMNR